MTTWQIWSDANKLLLNAMPKILSELSRVMSASGSSSFQVSSPAVVEEDFPGLRFIQFKDILRHPWCNVIDLSIPCADVGGRDD